jgi:hypothetical protein
VTDDFAYQLAVLRQMIGCLSGHPRTLLLEQLDKVIEALTSRNHALTEAIHTQVDDVILEVKALEFDLEATRRERDSLQQRLDDLS